MDTPTTMDVIKAEPSFEEENLDIKNETEDFPETTNTSENIQIDIKHEFHLNIETINENETVENGNESENNDSESNLQCQDLLVPRGTGKKEEYYQTVPIHNPQNITEVIKSETNIAELIPDQTPTTLKLELHTEDTEVILPINSDELKEEIANDSHTDMVSYDYPNFDDSMDSSEAAALSQVEACLNDNVSIKSEYEEGDDFDEKQINQTPKIIKEDPDLTVTETHIISNKVIDTQSDMHPGLQSHTRALIMEIHPLTRSDDYKMNPEEILPTTSKNYATIKNADNFDDFEDNCDTSFQDSFQLNSITGNVLSLEQEAYGLLQSNKKKSKSLKCHKCPKTCTAKATFVYHMKVHDSIERRALGVKKQMKTRKENDKKREIARSQTEQEEDDCSEAKNEGYSCTCGQVFQRRSRMETCLRSHNLLPECYVYTCSTCDKKFKLKSDLIYHRNRQHKRKFPCKFCPKDYDSQKLLFKHLQNHQKVQLTEYKVISEISKGKKDLHCLFCSRNFDNLPDLKLHVLEGHSDPYNCANCEAVFSKISDFIEHMRSTHPNNKTKLILDVIEAFSKLVKAWKCEVCGVQFYDTNKLALHQINDHDDMKIEQHFQCEDCQRIFVSAQGLNSHRRMHHPKEVVEKVEPEEIGVLCLECRKVCKDMPALASHMRLHSMDRKYPCKFCDFRFATPQKRKIHSEIHTGDMKYVCFICEYQCSSENRLKQHKMSLKHLNMKEYLLTGKPLIEEEPVIKKKKVKDKKQKESKKKDKSVDLNFACDICGQQFLSETKMSEHKSTHPFIEFPNDENPTRIFFK